MWAVGDRVTWTRGDLLGFDLETTGVDPATALPVSFALVSHGSSTKGRYGLVNPQVPIPAETTAIHGITDADVAARGGDLERTTLGLVQEVLRAAQEGVPLVGCNLRYDLGIIDRLHRNYTGVGLVELGYAGPVLDVLVLDRHCDRYRRGKRTLSALCAHYGVQAPSLHQAQGDALASIEVLLEIAKAFPEVGNGDLDLLFVSQRAWHREWATEYSTYRVSKGQPGLDEAEMSWPLGKVA